MVGFAPFQCDQNDDRNASRLCLNGATCSIALVGGQPVETCLCPAGFIHDYTIAHYPNCAMPEYILAVFFGILTSVTVVALMVALPTFTAARGQLKRFLGLGILQNVLNIFFYLCIWLQQGQFQPGSALLLLLGIITARQLVEGTLIMCAPVFAMLHKPIDWLRNTLVSLEVFAAVAQFICVVFLIIHCRDADPNTFNSITIIFQVFFVMTMSSTAACIFFASRWLWNIINQNIRGSQESDKLSASLLRVGRMKAVFFAGLVYCSTMAVLPIMTGALGSFPGQYVYMFIIHLGIPTFLVLETLAVRAESKNSLTSVEQTGNHTLAISHSAQPRSKNPGD